MSEVSWAAELGIDRGELMAEHPLSRESLLEAGASARKAEKYWSKDRMLARVEAHSEPVTVETVVEPVKIAVKRTRVKNYVFTEAQMRAAERSLNAGGAV